MRCMETFSESGGWQEPVKTCSLFEAAKVAPRREGLPPPD
jgi:hypothetical protein